MSEKVEFHDVSVERETGEAILCDIDGDKYWIPKSQIHDDSEVHNSANGEGTLAVTRWFADRMEEERASTRTTHDQACEPVTVTPDQREVFDRAVAHVRREFAKNDMHGVPEGRCLELICADYLAGAP